MDDIRILRLQSGEDVIAKYKEDEGNATIKLTDPMAVFFKRLPSGQSMMMLSPWLPLEIIENNIVTIFVGDVLTDMKPKQTFSTYYRRLVNETNIEAYEASKQIEESLLNPSTDISFDDLESDDDLEDELENYLYSDSNTKVTIH